MQPELTSIQLLEVAKRLAAQRMNIREVGLLLDLEEHTIQGILNNKQRDIVEAAHDMLITWRGRVATPQEAYDVLVKAMLKCKHEQIVRDVFGSRAASEK